MLSKQAILLVMNPVRAPYDFRGLRPSLPLPLPPPRPPSSNTAFYMGKYFLAFAQCGRCTSAQRVSSPAELSFTVDVCRAKENLSGDPPRSESLCAWSQAGLLPPSRRWTSCVLERLVGLVFVGGKAWGLRVPLTASGRLEDLKITELSTRGESATTAGT